MKVGRKPGVKLSSAARDFLIAKLYNGESIHSLRLKIGLSSYFRLYNPLMRETGMDAATCALFRTYLPNKYSEGL